MDPIIEPRAVILVEGVSDRAALTVLARRRGRDLAGEGVEVVAMNGATNIAHALDRYGPAGIGARVAGLYDIAEERFFVRALERAGLWTGPAAGLEAERGSSPVREGLEKLGFFVCDTDLEDELIRALGTDALMRIVEAEGELRSFRTLQRQPAQRERSLHDQLHRMMGARSGHKERYAELMAEAVGLDRVPRSLDAVFEFVS